MLIGKIQASFAQNIVIQLSILNSSTFRTNCLSIVARQHFKFYCSGGVSINKYQGKAIMNYEFCILNS